MTDMSLNFQAAAEQLRPPRVVRLGLIQNKAVLPTTEPYADQARVRTSFMFFLSSLELKLHMWYIPHHFHTTTMTSLRPSVTGWDS